MSPAAAPLPHILIRDLQVLELPELPIRPTPWNSRASVIAQLGMRRATFLMSVTGGCEANLKDAGREAVMLARIILLVALLLIPGGLVILAAGLLARWLKHAPHEAEAIAQPCTGREPG